MKKIYFTKESLLQARRDRRAFQREFTKSKEKYIERVTESGCWIWIGSCWEKGYGYVRYGSKGNIKIVPAHRYIYEYHTKIKIPKGLDLCHKCDLPACVNPSHMFIGTRSENLLDMYAKGRRNNRGTNNPNYKHGKYVNSDSIKWN